MPTMIAVAVRVNSNMFAHGTRPAAMPRSTSPATWSTQARMVSASAIRANRLRPGTASLAASAPDEPAPVGRSSTAVEPAEARWVVAVVALTRSCSGAAAARRPRSSANTMNASA